jgi:hypothetical protein
MLLMCRIPQSANLCDVVPTEMQKFFGECKASAESRNVFGFLRTCLPPEERAIEVIRKGP